LLFGAAKAIEVDSIDAGSMRASTPRWVGTASAWQRSPAGAPALQEAELVDDSTAR